MDVIEYPFPLNLRWSHLRWVPVDHTRLLNSTARLHGHYEVVGMTAALIAWSYQQEPPATLPDDDTVLAQMLGVEVVRWQDIRNSEMSPLHGWVPCRCGGEIRLTHPLMLQALEFSVKAHKLRQRGTRARRMWQPPDAGKAPE